MSDPNQNNNKRQVLHFLQKKGFAVNIDKVRLTPLSGDGSSRLFFNIKTETASFCGVLPAKDNTQKGFAEAHAAFNIGSHLKKRGLPVPVIHAFDPVSGFILFEDLGDTLLHDLLLKILRKSHSPHFPATALAACFLISRQKPLRIAVFCQLKIILKKVLPRPMQLSTLAAI